jgi:hypothetical protein
MKLILYYILLLVFIALLTGYMISANGGSMSMSQMLPVGGALILYVVGLSLVGEGKVADERETQHRYFSNRAALIGGTVLLSLGILYQMFIGHHLDYWLLAGLIVINLVKITSFIYLNYKN